MNKDIFEGKWNEYKGKVKEKWGKLTDNELTEINGKREKLLGKLQARYGYSEDIAKKHLDQFEQDLSGNVKQKMPIEESFSKKAKPGLPINNREGFSKTNKHVR